MVAYDDVHLDSWRRNIGWVPQRELLIQGSDADNIIMGRDGLSVVDVKLCWRDLGFESPKDQQRFWETELKPEGHGLSGGELRRLLLTRAFLTKPAVLILDEPETFQDEAGREAVRQALAKVGDDRTVILVSHQASSIFEGGRRIKIDAKRFG